MSEMILLGAGASVETGIPDAIGMTQKMLDLFGTSTAISKHSQVLRFVIGGLLFQKGGRGENPFSGVNIEDVFNAIQTLAERQTLEAAPFMGSWHPKVEELDVLEPSFGSRIQSVQLHYQAPSAHNIDHSLAETIKGRSPFTSVGAHIAKAFQSLQQQNIRPSNRGAQARPGEGEIFKRTNDRMIRQLVNLVWIEDSSKVNHLKPLIKTTTNRVIATLNYDNTIELAGAIANISVETGIEEMNKTGRFPENVTGVSLLKLHGSIDWAWKSIGVSTETPLRSEVIEHVTPELMRKEGFTPALIFGQRNKLTAHGPFLSLLEEFRRKLNDSNVLTVIGYSFRDSHINEYLTQWINENPERKMRIINGENFSPSRREFAYDLIGLKSRVEVLSVNASVGIQQLYGTETV